MTCDPRYETLPTLGRKTIGPRIAAVAEKLRHPLMPWQRLVAEVGGELVQDEETGFWVPAYSEVIITVPRQNGKTTEVLAWEIDRAQLWEAFDGRPQSIAYTAQSGSEARKKFRKDQIPLLKKSPFWKGVENVRLSAEDMSIEFSNGSSLSVWNNSDDAGHGSTIDLGVMDEIFADKDERREQAILPAMATRHDRQKLVTSTAGDEFSTVLDRKQAAGRAAVVEGRTEGIAYFEWSADPKADPESAETWRSCMPALGITITERTVRNALEEMRQANGNLAEFKRAWLNVPQHGGGGQVIPEAVWLAVCSSDMPRPEGGLVVGVDAHPDRSAAAIVIADRQGRCELVDYRPGTSWVLERVKEVSQRWGAEIVVDVAGPLGGLIDPLQLAGRKVYAMQPREVAYATANMYDRVADGKIQVKSSPLFDIAVAGAQRQPVGDGWRWGRRTSDVDVSPLVALTIALGRAVRKRVSAYEEIPADG